jgi:hypothetical protein
VRHVVLRFAFAPDHERELSPKALRVGNSRCPMSDMQKVFLAFSFNSDSDRRLADDVQSLLRSHGLTTVTGERLGGESLTPAIQAAIGERNRSSFQSTIHWTYRRGRR